MSLEDSPEEPHYRSELSFLSPASPKPLHFPAPTNIPVLNNMMDVEYNQTELHMQNPAMRNTDIRDGAWQETKAEDTDTGKASEDNTEESAPAGTSETAAVPAVDANAEQVTTLNDKSVTAADAPHVLKDDSGHDNQQTQRGDLDPTNDVNTGQPQPGFHDENAVAETTSPANHEPAPDADTFLSQIQNVALPNNGLDAPSLMNVAQPVSANPNPSTSTLTTPAGHENGATNADLVHFLQNNPSSHVTPTTLQHFTKQQGADEQNTPQTQSYHVPSDTPRAAEGGPANPSLPNVTTLQSLFPSGTLPADLAASLMQTTSQSSPNSHALPAPLSNSVTPLESRRERKLAAGQTLTSDEERWTAEIQQKYDEFIQDERRYVNEGRWDSFPQGSRLFVGNLSSESVTKRDIFHVFHSYGRLAQISIKQAFGFVQFLNAEDCTRALEGEQGRQIMGKKIHLEISKPQKPRNQAAARERRSRSPEARNAGARSGIDRYSGSSRADRPPFRSPSPRRGYRDRYDDRYRERSRTPPGFSRNRRYGRSPSPRGRDLDDDLPLPKRAAHEIPEVQIIVIDNLDREFVGWVEKAFSARGIRVAVLLLSPRLDEQAVVKRQILEGVLAVSKLTRASQNTGKIDLQIFDRRGGQSNVRFEEYSNLDPPTCAELVLRARSTHSAPPPPPPVQYGYNATPSYIQPPGPPAQFGYAPPSTAPQYASAPPFPPPHAPGPQYAYPPTSGYNPSKTSQQSAAPPQFMPTTFAGYGPPPVVQPVSYPPNPTSLPASVPQQPGQAAGTPQAGQVDMQQILARLVTYNK